MVKFGLFALNYQYFIWGDNAWKIYQGKNYQAIYGLGQPHPTGGVVYTYYEDVNHLIYQGVHEIQTRLRDKTKPRNLRHS